MLKYPHWLREVTVSAYPVRHHDTSIAPDPYPFWYPVQVMKQVLV
jgi:hypothetical protein